MFLVCHRRHTMRLRAWLCQNGPCSAYYVRAVGAWRRARPEVPEVEPASPPDAGRPCRWSTFGSTSDQSPSPRPNAPADGRATKRCRTRTRLAAGPAPGRRSPGCTRSQPPRAPWRHGGVHDDGDHVATAATRARQNVGGGEHPAQQLGPWGTQLARGLTASACDAPSGRSARHASQ